jgi:hypothetical protein
MFRSKGRPGGLKDMTKLIAFFRNFVNAPKNSVRTSIQIIYATCPVHPVLPLPNVMKLIQLLHYFSGRTRSLVPVIVKEEYIIM